MAGSGGRYLFYGRSVYRIDDMVGVGDFGGHSQPQPDKNGVVDGVDRSMRGSFMR